jgi:hypothetical protein
MKKKTVQKFSRQLSELIEESKLNDEGIVYILAHALIGMSAGQNPEEGLNRMFQVISIAAGEQGYRFKLENHTLH